MTTVNNKDAKMLVVKDNALINASYNLELVEQRVILLSILEARESGKGISADDFLVIHASSYMQNFGVGKHAAYKALRAACDDLFERRFSYQSLSEKGNVQQHRSRWVSEVVYNENEATIKLIFAPAVVPLITRLEEQFTSYEIEQVANLKSKYAMRLYELLVTWKSAGKTPEIELEDFRGKLGLGSAEYKAMGDFKKHVLDLAIKQLNEFTDIIASYEQHKKGRTITGFSFRFKVKAAKKAQQLKQEPTTAELFAKFTDPQRYLFSAKLANLPEVGSEYAQAGETQEDFVKRLGEMLKEEKHFQMFLPLLKEVGYNPK